MQTWRRVGIASAVLAWVLSIVTQAVAHDFLPPEISVSQYGVGRNGWLFSGWILSISLACAALFLARPERSRAAGAWLSVGIFGTVVMALIRTQAGGLQQTWNAKVHLVGAVLTVSAIPIGICLALRTAGRIWSRLALGLAVASAPAYALLLMAAAGIDTTGRGAASSWAFWQGVAAVLEMLLLACFAAGVAFTPAPARPGRPGRAVAGRPGSDG